ncbi:MAG: hypothetical protein WAW23_05490, partial [Candidatus Methanoperedens sp.]
MPIHTQTPIAETEFFDPNCFAVPKGVDITDPSSSWIFWGFKGVGKTKLMHYLAVNSEHFVPIGNISVNPTFSAFKSCISDDAKSGRHVWPIFWKFTILCSYLQTITNISHIPEELRPITRILTSHGFLPSTGISKAKRTFLRILKSVKSVGPIQIDFNELLHTSRVFGVDIDAALVFAYNHLRALNIRITFGIDGMDKASSIDNDTTAEPSPIGVSIILGLIQALYEIHLSFRQLQPQGSFLLNIFSFLRADLFHLAVSKVPEKTHVLGRLNPIEISWNRSELREIILRHLNYFPAYQDLVLDVEGNNETESFISELALADRRTTPRDAIEAARHLIQHPETRIRFQNTTVIISAKRSSVQCSIQFVCEKRLDDTLSSIGVDIHNVLAGLRTRPGLANIKALMLHSNPYAITPTRETVGARIRGLGIADVADETLRICPLYCNAYG